MHINTYGAKRCPCVLLLHTMFTTGALFREIVPLLQDHFFLVVPTLDGFHPDDPSEYPGADPELLQIEEFLLGKKIDELAVAAGSSLGAMLVLRLWQRGNIPVRHLIMDSPPLGWPSTMVKTAEKNFWELILSVRAEPATPCIFDKQYGAFGSEMRQSCLTVTKNTILRCCETCFGQSLPDYIQTEGTDISLIYGECDPNYQEKGKALGGRKDISLTVKPGCGHCSFLMTDPLAFTKLLLEVSQ